MSDRESEVSQDVICDSSSSTEHVSLRPLKRRRIARTTIARQRSVSDDESPYTSPDSSANNGTNERRDRRISEESDEKPKSRHKIHIPKNADMPRDAFLTQPPTQPASPHRIERFCWQKPRDQNLDRSANARKTSIAVVSGPLQVQNAARTTAKRTLHTENGQNLVQADTAPRGQEDEFDGSADYEDILAQLPSDAFSSPATSRTITKSQPHQVIASHRTPGSLIAPLNNLKQTTLFGTQAPSDESQAASKKKRNWPLAQRDEPPTHHSLDYESMQTWVYPTNLGAIRDYQYSIVAKGLYHNMLVALPTGLGKTFIAATIMLNWFRWTKTAQIVFVAPTKPLVSQQVKACFQIAGIPRSATTMLTGTTAPGLRAEEWRDKRVFFMTPQTLINDLKSGISDPKRIVLVVVDEAHRATGSYAYVEVVNFLKRFNSSFRVLALTATPGSSIETVQEVIDGLGISRIEIRTEDSIDIRQYVHQRKIETVLFDNSEEITMLMDLFAKALQPVLDKLTGMNAYWNKDPMALTPYGLTQAKARFFLSDAGKKASPGVKGMIMNIFTLLASLAHSIELLKYHGVGPFYHKILAFRNELHTNGKKGGKEANSINNNQSFQTMMSRVQLWINSPDFVGHPKLEYVQSVVMNHFLDAGDGRGAADPSSTRIMVFAHFRDSAEEIARVLRRNSPMIRPHVFVGQANTKGSEGMDQKRQLDIIEKFKLGTFNTLVATSIGEEGLDIGEVDLIICYDASASPIRMLQRMGRTGRKRAGNIVVTLMRGKEENNFVKAKDNYEKMQAEIASGAKFNFHDEESRRIVPKDIQPVVDKRVVDIPVENSQPDLPEPSKRGRVPKRPPKKFNMPDGVRTGFVKASRLGDENDDDLHDVGARRRDKAATTEKVPVASPMRQPRLQDVILTSEEERSFERRYLEINGNESEMISVPRLDAQPQAQSRLRPIGQIGHSSITQSVVAALSRAMSMNTQRVIEYEDRLSINDRLDIDRQSDLREKRLRQDRDDGTSRIEDIQSGSSSPKSQRQGLSGLDEGDLEMLDEDPVVNASSSSRPSSPSLDAAEKPFYLSQKRADTHSDTDDDLPDVGLLVEREETVRTENRVMHERRRRKLILDDDSDA